jgi:hypothetical protein
MEATKENFRELGKKCGVHPQNLVDLTTDYVWQGGDPQDMKWVKKALRDMELRDDLSNRWYKAWRAFLGLTGD